MTREELIEAVRTCPFDSIKIQVRFRETAERIDVSKDKVIEILENRTKADCERILFTQGTEGASIAPNHKEYQRRPPR